jgi:nicotinate-nucleotide adenylyltransferase
MKKPIGILGGTFDPIHFGHLRTAIELHQTLDLAQVRLIPCFQPVHRKMPIASPEQRLAMVKHAIEFEPALCVDHCEIQRKGPSYTIDTLIELHQKLPDTPFCLIMGIDALLNFPSWNRWENILELAHLVIAHRPNYQLPHTGIVADLLKQRLQPVTALEISATDIRKQIAMGANPRFLLPNNVLKYIKQHGTYSISRL